MNTKRKLLIMLIAFAFIIGGAYFAYNLLSAHSKPAGTGVLNENKPSQSTPKITAPDFTVKDAQGNSVKLSDFIGKPVVLNFWASWCPPCKSELPDFEKTYADVKDDVVFLMVDLVDGQRETQNKGQAYFTDNGFKMPIYFDVQQDAAAAYGISSIPTTVFIDRDGKMIKGYQGAIDEKTLRAGIEIIQ